MERRASEAKHRQELGWELDQRRATQLDLWTRHQAEQAGYSKGRINGRVRSGRWIIVLPGVLALPGITLDHDHLLLAACLARPSAVASHESAAWLWGLLEHPPDRPTVSVPRTAYQGPLGPLRVRRVTDLPAAHIVTHRSTPCTDGLRTLVDLAAAAPELLDDAVDKALMRRLVSVEGLLAEIGRLRRPGRRGVGILERSLRRRGLVGVPGPSVLESKLLRLLHRMGLEPAGVEVTVVGEDGQYRLDTLLVPGFAVEVDGFSHHGRAGDLTRDAHRHNQLTRLDLWVLRFTWQDVVHHPDAVTTEIRDALAEFGDRAPR